MRLFLQVMTTYPELQSYLEIPGELSRLATAEPDRDGVQYGAFSEHLVMALGEMFTVRGVGGFPKLTEIVLGREACNTSLRMTGRDGRDISAELFRGIGMACPNLKVLDVSSVICLAPECILFMLFHDAYQTLHQ